jgi:hypothetical protein
MMQFELKGESADLGDLARLFPTGTVAVKKIEASYFLQLPDRESPLDDNDALEVAKVALSRLSGIALLDLGNFRPPEIKGISKIDRSTGKLATFLSMKVKVEARSRSHGTLQTKLADGTIATNQSRTFSEIVMALADENKHLNHALRVFGQESDTWGGLYKVLDAIREPYGKKLEYLYKQFPAYKSDIKNFKHHADCFAKLGKDARHGFLNWKPPKQNMTLTQAQTLIRNLISAWVKKLTPEKGLTSA